MEKDRDRLDKILEDLTRRGLVRFPITEEFVEVFERSGLTEKLDDKEIFELYEAARAAFVSEAIQQARATLPRNGYSVADLVRRVLTDSKITDTELALRLGVDLAVLRSVRENTFDPTRLPVSALVNLMELAAVKLSELVAVLQNSLRLLAGRARITGVYARSDAASGSSERSAALGQAVDALLAKTNQGSAESKVDLKLIETVREEARKRGRDDLLT